MKGPRPDVSVIVPTHDRPGLLCEAVTSLLRQSRPPREIIVVDDGSRFECRRDIEHVGGMHPSIALFHLGENRGAAAARNFGLERASGDFVVFLDDDDLLHPRALELNGDFLAAHPDRDILVCRSRMFFSEPTDGIRAPGRLWLIDQFNGRRLERNPLREILRFAVPINAVMIRRACLNKAPFPDGLRMGEERLFLLNLARQGCRFASHSQTLSFVRIHPGNAQLGPGAAEESERFLRDVLSGDLLATGHDRFICHARLLQLFLKLPDRSIWNHLHFLFRFPHLLLFYGSWYLIIQVKKKNRRARRESAAPQPQGWIGP